MNKCKTCKFFKRHTAEYDNSNYGRCQSGKMLYGETTKDGIDSWANGKKKSYTLKDTDFLLYMDAEDYDAQIEVGQDFGCIHYQKEEENDR